VDRDQPIATLRPLGDLVSASIARERFAATLFAVFSVVALLLAAAGIYGVMAYAVAERRSEIGVRLALGAQVGDVLALVVGQGSRLVAVGLALGLAGALLAARLLEAMLFGVSAHDPVSFVVTAFLLAIAGLLACLVPALRASAVSPSEALRAD
jgi:putative ABC transport system permease protein